MTYIRTKSKAIEPLIDSISVNTVPQTIDDNKNVDITVPEELNDLSNVTLTTPTDGQALLYDSTSGEWKNSDISSSLSELEDTTITTPSDGQLLTYDTTTSKWVNETLDLSGKVNEPSSEGTDGQFLTTDGYGGRIWTTVKYIGIAFEPGKSYLAGDLIMESNTLYKCTENYTATDSFSTDLAAGKWVVYQVMEIGGEIV